MESFSSPWVQQRRRSLGSVQQSHPLVEELLDERLPEVLLHPFGLQNQAVVQLAQPLHEAVWRRRQGPEVPGVEVLREACRGQKKLSFLSLSVSQPS